MIYKIYYVEINKGMYGRTLAGKLANDALIKHLTIHSYNQCNRTPGLFTHESRPVQFCLVVNDFGIKYTSKDNAKNLIKTLQSKYKITVDWSEDTYLGMHLDWNYTSKYVDISMPNYVTNAL
jgi:hypothetical protein